MNALPTAAPAAIAAALRRRAGLMPGQTWAQHLELTLGRVEMYALQRALCAAAGLTPARAQIGELELALYERRRPGTPMVMLHGFGGDKETWLLMAPWLRKPPLLLVDLPGHGGSSPLPRQLTTAAGMGGLLIDLLDERGLARVHLCGNSLGGGLALWLARHHPERIASLTLIASAAPDPAESELTRALARGDNLLIPGSQEAERFIKLMAERPPRVPQAVTRYITARRVMAAPRLQAMFRAWIDSDPADGLPGDLEAITQPTLIIHGEKDRIVHADTARRVHARMPRAQLHIMPGIGHVPQLEQPAAVARLIARHLQEVAP
jgi:abhydrolase domain-containing protein 6